MKHVGTRRSEVDGRPCRSAEGSSGGSAVAAIRYVLLGAWCFLLGSSWVAAQSLNQPIAVRDVSVRFEHLTVADGLSQTTIYAIYQDRHGFIWFATQDGLNRYDGHSIRVYRHVPFDSTALGDNTVVAITEDHQGYMWVASGRGLHRMHRGTERFTAFRSNPDDPTSLGDNFVRHVHTDRDGVLWVATQGGLERFNRESETFTHFRHDPDDSTSISHNNVSYIYEDGEGGLWIAAVNGLNRLRPDKSGFDRFLVGEVVAEQISPTDYRMQRMLERPEEPGILWVGTTAGLLRFDPETGQSSMHIPANESSVGRIADLVQDPIARNVLWLAMPGAGLGRFDIRTGRYSIHGTDPTDPQSLSTTNTERVFVDRSGMLWVGVNGVGVDRFNPATIGMSHLRHDPGSSESLPGSHVRGIHQDQLGRLWVGTTDRQGVSRLSRFDPRTRNFVHFEHRPGDPNSIGPGRIRSIIVDQQGAVWIGTGVSGLARMPPDRPGWFQRYVPDPDDPSSLSHYAVRYLLEDHSGTIWVATNGGLDRVVSARDGEFLHYRHVPGDETTLTSNRGSVLYESRAGFIWVGADGGLNRLEPVTGAVQRYQHDEEDPTSLSSDAVLSIAERAREPAVIWIGTFGGGLNRLDVETGKFKHYTEQDGLPNNTVYGILEDARGRLWMSTNVGLSRFDPDSETFRNYGLDVGLQSLEFNSAAFHKGPFGEMFFGGVNGLNAFFPDELTENTIPPDIVIVDVRLAHRSVREYPDLTGGEPVTDLQRIRLGHDQTDVAFDYVALHFQNPAQNTYAYRLMGYDDDWIDAGGDRTATYTNLSPGDYSFRVRAANSDGIWNEDGASIDLMIEPPWWRTWWALTIYLVIVVAGIAGMHRIQSGRLLRAERERANRRALEDARTIEAAYKHLQATQDQLVQAEKMASLGHLTAGIAHEIRNPLNFVNNFTKLTDEAVDEFAAEFGKHRHRLPEDVVEQFDEFMATVRYNTERVGEHGRRADAVVKNMLRHSLSSKSERHPTDVNGLLREYSTLVQRSYEARYPELQVCVETDFDSSLGRIDVVPQDIGRVFKNVLDNAYDALREKLGADEAFQPEIRISTVRRPGEVEIRIADNGPGIAPDIRDKVFNPFFTTKEVGRNAGLGLSMSYEIVAAHGGVLELDDHDSGGTVVVIRLPI